MERFEKQPTEKFAITADFSANMEVAETLVSATVVAVTATGAEASSADNNTSVIDLNTVQYASKVAQVVVQNGVDNATTSPYKITFKVVTSLGWKWELDVKMKVKDG